MGSPIVSCEELRARLDDPRVVVFDCRHDLTQAAYGPRAYEAGHIPGAFHAHIDRDLAGPVGDGSKGRHPLPLRGAFVRFLRLHGVGKDSTVVAYDDGPGNWAARLWWLLRHYGHADATVLDGGIGRWKKLGFPLRAGHERPRGDGDFDGQPGHMPTTDAAAILATLDGAGSERWALVDVRARERYRGDTEPVDPVAGHIPGARNRPYSENVATDGRFLPPADLARTFDSVADGGRDVVVYCGSGVTSAQGVLAMEIAGLATPRLYPGSWSEWCRPAAKRPVERTDREA